ncbi:MAG: hypothetical protein ACPG7F_05585 [Aggregatilineales bacterium]
MEDLKISELTIAELKTLIRQTVQEAVAEVIIEFSIAAEIDEQIAREAELNEYLRDTMQQALMPHQSGAPLMDD